MKIGIFGTGMVARAHATKLHELGHEVMMGTQDVAKTLAKTQGDQMGNPGFSVWYKDNAGVQVGTFSETASFGEVLFDALRGEFAVAVLTSVANELGEKVLVDIANALDFSKGMPPTLLISNTDSLGEQIQKALPKVKVVKAFNTISAPVQVNPHQVAEGDHTLFISGNDETAKKQVTDIAKSWYGWRFVIDLGDISTARGTEMYLPLWLRLWGVVKTPLFNVKVVQ